LYLDRENGMPGTYCCQRVTPCDWLRLGALLAMGGKIGARDVLPSDWLDQMRTGSELNPYYGYGLWPGSPPDGKRQSASGGAQFVGQSEPHAGDQQP